MTKLQKLAFRIKQLSNEDHNKMFRMLVSKNIKHSKNKNGVFINLSALDPDIIEEMQCFVTLCEQHEKIEEKKVETEVCTKTSGFKSNTFFNKPVEKKSNYGMPWMKKKTTKNIPVKVHKKKLFKPLSMWENKIYTDQLSYDTD